MAKEIQLTYTAHVTEIYKDVDVGLFDPDREKNTIIRDIEHMVEIAGAVPDVKVTNFKAFVIDDDKEIRHCGNDWRYCDGDCNNCPAYKTYATDRTEVMTNGQEVHH